MADKAILFDSSRCSACQACVAACKGRFGLGPASSSEDMAARAFGRAAVLDEEAPLAVARFERTLADGGTVWEAARAGCVHCAEAPCVEVCPTGALVSVGETGFVTLDAERCVSCHLCAMVCPADAPRHRGERGELCLCDGCAAEVAEGAFPPVWLPARWTRWPSTIAMRWCPGPTSARRLCASAAGPTLQCSV